MNILDVHNLVRSYPIEGTGGKQELTVLKGISLSVKKNV